MLGVSMCTLCIFYDLVYGKKIRFYILYFLNGHCQPSQETFWTFKVWTSVISSNVYQISGSLTGSLPESIFWGGEGGKRQNATVLKAMVYSFCCFSKLKGKLRSKKVKLKGKSVKMKKKTRAITDLNAPNSSRDIPFQSQEFEQDGRRHSVGFQPYFHLNMTSQTQSCKTIKNERAVSQKSFVWFVWNFAGC